MTMVQELDIKSTTPLFQCNTKDWEFCLGNEVAVLQNSFGEAGKNKSPQRRAPMANSTAVRRTWFPTVPDQDHGVAS